MVGHRWCRDMDPCCWQSDDDLCLEVFLSELRRTAGVGVEHIVRSVEVDVELHRNLVYVVALAGVLRPDVFQVGTGDEHQVEVADDFAGVTHDAVDPFRPCHEVELKHIVRVNGVVETGLMPVGDIQEIAIL